MTTKEEAVKALTEAGFPAELKECDDICGGVIAGDGTVDYVETAEEPIADAPGEPEQEEEPKTEHKEEAIFG